MKLKLTVTISVVMLLGASNATAEVVINEVPLEQQSVSRHSGGEMYGNLCAVCHGASGKGDGPAVAALEKGVPDLTLLSFNNGGTFPHKQVESMIRGKSRTNAHDTIDMPAWEEQFMAMRAGWTGFPQKAYARNRIHSLATYIETIQVNAPADIRVAKAD